MNFRGNSLTETAWPQVGAIIVLFILGTALINGYSSSNNLVSILVFSSFVAIAASGQTTVALLGGIDLSIPAVMGLANVLTASLSSQGWPFWMVLLVIFAFALVIGAFNGLLSKALNINSLIVTLATGAIVGGAILAWTGGTPTGSAPKWLTGFVAPSGTFFGLPVPGVLIFWAFFSAVWLFALNNTIYGKWIYATGSSPVAASIAGVPTLWVWVVTFAMSACGAAIAGVLLAGFTSQGDVRVAAPYLFSTVACVVIGGTSLVGARGGYGRTILGAIILTQMTSMLIALGLNTSLQQAILGGLIIVVVASYGRDASVADRL